MFSCLLISCSFASVTCIIACQFQSSFVCLYSYATDFFLSTSSQVTIDDNLSSVISLFSDLVQFNFFCSFFSEHGTSKRIRASRRDELLEQGQGQRKAIEVPEEYYKSDDDYESGDEEVIACGKKELTFCVSISVKILAKEYRYGGASGINYLDELIKQKGLARALAAHNFEVSSSSVQRIEPNRFDYFSVPLPELREDQGLSIDGLSMNYLTRLHIMTRKIQIFINRWKVFDGFASCSRKEFSRSSAYYKTHRFILDLTSSLGRRIHWLNVSGKVHEGLRERQNSSRWSAGALQRSE
ncbi:hypothetical protein BDC45DRAFT_536288 [Circinella umbellata]|nr:hypothetical protein BDC45DRAFT_536288 [Circinella umbellata]